MAVEVKKDYINVNDQKKDRNIERMAERFKAADCKSVEIFSS